MIKVGIIALILLLVATLNNAPTGLSGLTLASSKPVYQAGEVIELEIKNDGSQTVYFFTGINNELDLQGGVYAVNDLGPDHPVSVITYNPAGTPPGMDLALETFAVESGGTLTARWSGKAFAQVGSAPHELEKYQASGRFIVELNYQTTDHHSPINHRVTSNEFEIKP